MYISDPEANLFQGNTVKPNNKLECFTVMNSAGENVLLKILTFAGSTLSSCVKSNF